MSGSEPQTSAGMVLWSFMMSMDGFVAAVNQRGGQTIVRGMCGPVARGCLDRVCARELV